jgi:hypothetical protein
MSEILACAVPAELKEATYVLAARELAKPSEIMRRAIVRELRAAGVLDGGEQPGEPRRVAVA